MVDCLKNNSLLFSALAVAIAVYCGLVGVKRSEPYSSLLPSQSVVRFEGRIISPPSISGAGARSCKAAVSLSRVWNKDGLAAAAKGQALVFFPMELCQIYQPGKLYSAWRGEKTDFLLDQGAVVTVRARPARYVQQAPAGQQARDGQPEPVGQQAPAGQQARFAEPAREGQPARGGGARPGGQAAPARQLALECVGIEACSFEPGALGLLQKIRALSHLHFTRLMFAWGEAGGFLLALLSGSRSYLSQDAADAFRMAGLSHVLALSGMHLSLIGGLAFGLAKRPFGKKAARGLEFLFVLLFVWFAGKSPSLFRALLCSMIAFASALFKVKAKSPLNSLSFAFVIHVALFPADAFELSFELSYGALFGILLFSEFAAKNLTAYFPKAAGQSLGASAGAQFVTAPISLRAFGLFAPVGIFSSAVVSPFVTLFVYAGIFFVLLSLAFPFFAPVCGGLLGIFYDWISRAVFFFAAIPCVKI